MKGVSGSRLPSPSLYVGPDQIPINDWDEFGSPFRVFQIELDNEAVLSTEQNDYSPYQIYVSGFNIGQAVVKLSLPSSVNYHAISAEFIVKVRDGEPDFKFIDVSDVVVDKTSAPFTRIASGGHSSQVTYTFSDPKVAIVEKNTGQVKTKAIGKITISAVSQGQGGVGIDFSQYSLKVTDEELIPPTVFAWIGEGNTELILQNLLAPSDFVIASNSSCQPDTLENCQQLTMEAFLTLPFLIKIFT